MEIYLGIDFGTATNYIVRWDNDKKDIKEEQFGEHGSSNVFDNVIYYTSTETVIGNIANKRAVSDNPLNLVKYIKREIDKDNWSTYIPSRNKHYTSMQISTDIFREIKKKVESN
ncbi:MAG: Hsp70 family protein, partial [Peptostreptococcaceae bacterium]